MHISFWSIEFLVSPVALRHRNTKILEVDGSQVDLFCYVCIFQEVKIATHAVKEKMDLSLCVTWISAFCSSCQPSFWSEATSSSCRRGYGTSGPWVSYSKMSVNFFFWSATPCASPPPWPSIFSDYSFWVHHLVNQDDRQLLAHAMASDFSVAWQCLSKRTIGFLLRIKLHARCQ
jgi:hypothetical protein